MNPQTLLIICAFASVMAVAYFVVQIVFGDKDEGKLRSRLTGDKPIEPSKPGEAPAKTGVAPILSQIGQAAAQPFMPNTREKQSAMRRELAHAGIYNPASIRMVQGSKVIGLVGGLVLGYIAGMFFLGPLLTISIGGLIGYVGPTMWLKFMIKRNQKSLDFGLADALDLMVVCVEAGLTVDAAMQRVGQELALVHPALSREFGITHMETRVGLARAEALRNMGQRTGNAAMISLAAMLNQADRFGTSIAQALRIHADSLRVARQHKAEEMAAKSAVKMSFPLVLFIFPATFIVLLGPVIIQLMHSDLMK